MAHHKFSKLKIHFPTIFKSPHHFAHKEYITYCRNKWRCCICLKFPINNHFKKHSPRHPETSNKKRSCTGGLVYVENEPFIILSHERVMDSDHIASSAQGDKLYCTYTAPWFSGSSAVVTLHLVPHRVTDSFGRMLEISSRAFFWIALESHWRRKDCNSPWLVNM